MDQGEYEKLDRLEDRMWWFLGLRRHIEFVMSKFAGDCAESLLDAGCGTGGFLRRLSAQTTLRSHYGIDINADAVEIAKKKNNLPIVQGSINHLPFAGGAFATVVSSDIIDIELVDPSAAVAEIYRCLRPGGALILSVPAYQWMKSTHDMRVHTGRRFTRAQLAALLGQAGFEVTYITYCNTILFPLMVVRRKIFGRFLDTSDLREFPAALNWTFGTVMILENFLLRLHIRLPFGGTVLAVGRKPSSL